MVYCISKESTGVLVKPPWYGVLDKQGGKPGVLVKPPWYGMLDKQGGVHGALVKTHGMV